MWGREIIAGIVSEVRRNHDWQLIIDPRNVQHRLEIPDGWKGQGIITSLRDDELTAHVQATQLPVVNVSTWGSQCTFASCVVTDDGARAEMAFRYLRARGHANFAFYSPIEHTHLTHRGRKFAELVRQSGMNLSIYPDPAKPTEQQILASEWLQQLPLPTAILAANPQPALQLTELCRSAGLRVPQDIAILSCDTDDLLCTVAAPPLSSIELAGQQIGRKAVMVLAEHIQNPDKERSMLAVPPVRIVERLSTSAIAVDDPILAEAIRYLHANAANGINVGDILEAVPISRRTLEQQFASLLGTSPAAEIRRLRLQHIRHLLASTTLSIAQVSKRSGFTNPSRLSEFFRSETGQAPNEYRRELRG